jgi:predicted RNase H-like HicB family nuclease
MTFTAVYMAVPEGYIGFVEEIPGANSQGKTLDEVRENLRDFMATKICRELEIAWPGDQKKPGPGESNDVTDTP